MIKDIRDNEIMDAFDKLIPYLKAFFGEEASFAINNSQQCLKYIPNNSIPLDIKEGDKLIPGSATYKSIKEGIMIETVVPKEVFGTIIKSTSIPIKDDTGEVVGNLAIARTLKKQEEILDLSKDISESLEEISSALGQISGGIQNAGKSSKSILTNIQATNEKTKDTDSVLEFIRNVANKTNLLGLNASIEASRAGEAGKGFSVVAAEIRKLSNSSNESIKKIENVIKEIQKSVSTITGDVDEVNGVFQHQIEALQQIATSIEKLSDRSQQLEEKAAKF